MRVLVLFLILFFGFLAVKMMKSNMPTQEDSPFELSQILRINIEPSQRFDLSGILALDDNLKERFNLKSDFLLVNDQSSLIYEASLKENILIAKPWIDITQNQQENIHLTDIDTNSKSLFALDELIGIFFEIQPRLPKNKQHRISKVNTPWTRHFKPEGSGLETSIRIRDSLVYILDSANRCIWEEKLVEPAEPKKLSFKKYIETPQLQYAVYDDKHILHPEWGTASALEVVGDTFYVGLDNNGEGLLANPQETRASVMVLKRKH